MERTLYDQMYEVEQEHWWFKARRALLRRILVEKVEQGWLPPGKLEICDIGCGCGMTLVELQAAGHEVIGIDPEPAAVRYCLMRKVDARVGGLPELGEGEQGSKDVVLLLHVLEHVADDRHALDAALGLLRPGGLLVAMVPAYPWLWSVRDEHCHHHRRYTLGGLRRLVHGCAEVGEADLRAVNTLLLPLFFGQILGWKLLPAASAEGEYRLPSPRLNRLLGRVFAVEHLLWGLGVRMPAGITLVACLRRKGG